MQEQRHCEFMTARAQHCGQKAEITTERGLTEAQQKTLDAIRSYIDDHGISPSFRDVCELRGLASTSTVQMHLKRLQTAGAITLRQGVPRSLQVLWPRPKRRRSA
jgi:SOS-response transcriptional repressor LexA